MAFYGLSYDGEIAVRVPTGIERYNLSICSADFNSWTRKVAATDERFSFMYTIGGRCPVSTRAARLTTPKWPTHDPAAIHGGAMPSRSRRPADQWVPHEYATGGIRSPTNLEVTVAFVLPKR